MSGISKITVEIGGQVAASLGAALRSAQTQVSSFGRNVSRTMQDSATQGKKAFKDVFNSDLWQQATIGATAFVGAVGLSVKKAAEFDSAMADVRKAIDFKDGTAGVKRFGNELIKLSTELPYTAKELTNIAAAAGFAGYAENEIIPFTKAAARMGVAFQMTAAEAGDAMVAIRASMGLTQPEVEELGDAINHLSDKFQGTVNAADLVEVTRRIGAIGKASGLAKEEVAGLGAAFLASGTPTEVAATGLKNFLNALTKGDQATKKQVEALETMFGSDVSDKLAKGMQKDAEGTIKSVIQAMAKLDPDKRVSVAGALFGEESKAAIMPLLTNTKLLDQAFDLIADKSAFAGSMQKEFGNQMGTSAAQFQIFKNGIDAMGISIGAAILPSLNAIMKAVTPVLVKFAEFAQANEWLVTPLVLVGTALAGLIIALPVIAGLIASINTIGAAIGAVSLGATIAGWAGAIVPAIASIGGTIAGLAGVIGPAIGAVVTAITGPIGIAVLAIVGIGLAFKAAYDKIPAFRNAVKATMAGVVKIFTGAWAAIKATFGGFVTYLGGAWKVLTGMLTLNPGRMKEGFGQMFSGIKTMFGSWFGWLGSLVPGVTGVFTAMGNGIRSAFTSLIGFAKQAWAAIMSGGLGQYIEGIKQAFAGLGTFFQGVWNTIVGIFTLDAGKAVAGVKQAFSGLDQIGAGLLNMASGLGRLVVNGIQAGLQGITTVITTLGGLVLSGLQTLGSAIVSGLTALPGLIGSALSALGGIIGGIFSTIVSAVTGYVQRIIAVWVALPGQIISALQGLVAGVQGIFNNIVSFIQQTPARVASVGSAVIQAIIDGLKARAGALFGWISGTWDRIKSMVGGGGGDTGGGGRAPGKRAAGGPVSAGVPYIVGERRRELFVPGMDGGIIPRIARPVTAGAMAALMGAQPAAAVGQTIAATVQPIIRLTPEFSIQPPPINTAALPPAPAAPAAPGLPPGQGAMAQPTITINAPVTINAGSGNAEEIRQHVEAAFADIQHEMESTYRTLLND